MFRSSADAGGARWTFDGGTPSGAEGPVVTARWPMSGRQRVTLTVGGPGGPTVVHDLVVGGLPDVTGLDPVAAALALEGAGLHVSPDRWPVPALVRRDKVAGLRYHGAHVGPADVIHPGSTVDLEMSDGSKPVVTTAGSPEHTCALTVDGLVYCWGSNSNGQLGDDTTIDRPLPTLVEGLSDVMAIAGGTAESCALLSDHSARCWGHNDKGQLGDGSTQDRHRPVPVTGLGDAVEIAVNGAAACAIRADRSVSCWGDGGPAEAGTAAPHFLGPDHSGVSKVPVAVGVDDAVHLSTTALHICATLADGTARCWGSGPMGELGNGDRSYFGPEIVRVIDLDDAVDVGAGYLYTCALRRTGGVDCWGGVGNEPGVDPAGSPSLSPSAVARLDQVERLSAGYEHACVLRTGGTIWCWGEGVLGGLGNGSTDGSRVPLQVPSVSRAIDVTAVGFHTCAVLDDRSLYCWGLGPDGRGGDPATNFLIPTRIVVGQE